MTTRSHSRSVVDNCTVGAENPRTVTVEANGTVAVEFAIQCEARAANVEVEVATTGVDLDPDGYTMALTADSLRATAVEINDTVTFEEVPEGPVSVELSGVAANCYPDGEDSRALTVTYGQTASTTFEIECKPPVASLEIIPAVVEVNEGDTVVVAALARDAQGNVPTDRPLEWGVSDSTTARIEPIPEGAISGATVEGARDAGAPDVEAAPAVDDEIPDVVTGKVWVIGLAGGQPGIWVKAEGLQEVREITVCRVGGFSWRS